jgi:hypothetical protein
MNAIRLTTLSGLAVVALAVVPTTSDAALPSFGPVTDMRYAGLPIVGNGITGIYVDGFRWGDDYRYWQPGLTSWNDWHIFGVAFGNASPSTTPPPPHDYQVTTIYGIDMNPASPAMNVTGFNPVSPEAVSPGPEHMVSPWYGTEYTSSVDAVVLLSEIGSWLPPGSDLSPFANGNPNSLLYVSQTFVPSAEFPFGVPEPSTCVLLLCGVLGLGFHRRR